MCSLSLRENDRRPSPGRFGTRDACTLRLREEDAPPELANQRVDHSEVETPGSSSYKSCFVPFTSFYDSSDSSMEELRVCHCPHPFFGSCQLVIGVAFCRSSLGLQLQEAHEVLRSWQMLDICNCSNLLIHQSSNM